MVVILFELINLNIIFSFFILWDNSTTFFLVCQIVYIIIFIIILTKFDFFMSKNIVKTKKQGGCTKIYFVLKKT